jgi:hypothetical protein
MSDTPSRREAPPPPPPPRKSKTGLLAAIAAGLVLLCLCCAVIGVGIYLGRDSLSGLFATATPQGIYFDSPGLALSLYYPLSWTYSEAENTVIFATSQDVIDGDDFPASGAGLIVLRDASLTADLPSATAGASPEDLLAELLDPDSFMLGEMHAEIEPIRARTISGLPAASAVYSFESTGSLAPLLVGYFVLIDPDAIPVFLIGICPEGEWTLHRSSFDGMFASLEIRPLP